MKRLATIAILTCARAILAQPAAAEEATPAPESKDAGALVQRELIRPLASKERDQSRFSRARLPAQERRVRILDEQPRKDAAGDAFYTFAIDARHGVFADGDETQWRKATITGCVYLGRGEIFVKSGDQYRPAAFLLGKNLKPVEESICHGVAEVAKAQ
jgi:hypothetical protein